MDERPFFDKSIKPAKQTLQAVLGSKYTYYKKIISLVSAYSQEWTFSKSGGWMLKTYDRNKALFYLIPLKDGFKISLAIRENERAAFLCDGELGMMHDKISGSKKYIEGFSLQFEIANKNEFQPLELFIRKLIAIRL
ncbi:MAG TPA: DUF3788 family protein [Anaerolineales bacterium]